MTYDHTVVRSPRAAVIHTVTPDGQIKSIGRQDLSPVMRKTESRLRPRNTADALQNWRDEEMRKKEKQKRSCLCQVQSASFFFVFFLSSSLLLSNFEACTNWSTFFCFAAVYSLFVLLLVFHLLLPDSHHILFCFVCGGDNFHYWSREPILNLSGFCCC